MNWIKKLFFRPMTAEEVDERIRRAVDVEWLKSMQRLEVRDGDIVVIKHPCPLRAEASENLRGALKEIINEYGYKVNVMILDGGADIGVLTKSSDNQRVEWRNR